MLGTKAARTLFVFMMSDHAWLIFVLAAPCYGIVYRGNYENSITPLSRIAIISQTEMYLEFACRGTFVYFEPKCPVVLSDDAHDHVIP